MNSKISQHFAFLFIFIATVGRCDGENYVEEINYQLKEENLHSRQTGHHGDSLIIGSQPKQSSGRVTDIKYRCSRVSIDESYQKQYEIKVQRKSSTSYEVKPSEEYFMYYVKEVWQCNDSNRKLPDFMRIVNEAISTTEIFEVKFYDGVEVGTRNYESENYFNTVIKEIKYVNKKMEVIKFEGSLCLLKDDKNFHSIPNLLEQHYQYRVPPPNEEGYFKDQKNGRVDTHILISETGRSLKIGTRVTKLQVEERDTYTCRREGDVSQYSPLFLPKIQQKVVSDPDIFADVKDEDFFKKFMVVKREIYICIKTIKKSTLTGDVYEEYRYLRVVNDVIGLEQIKDIYYLGGIVSLSAISVPKNRVSVRFKEIRYKMMFSSGDPDSSWKDIYIDTVKFVEDSHSTLIMDGSIDMAYLLTPMSVFRTLIGSKGFDFRVGAAYTDQIGDETSSVKCLSSNKVEYTNAFNTVVKMKMHDDFFYSVVPIENGKESYFYKVISTEILECSNTEINFLRILNKIEVLVPVHEIETYDGVEIVGTVLDNGLKSVRIFEKKYLNSTSYERIKYVGKITFQPLDNAEATLEARKFAISKTVDDATRLFGYTAKRFPTMRDKRTQMQCASLGYDLPIGRGNILRIEKLDWMKATDTRSFSGDRAMCVEYKDINNKKKEKKIMEMNFPHFEVVDGANGKDVIKKFDEGDTNSEYFTTGTKEVFLCRNGNEYETNRDEFLRVETLKKLKKSTPQPIGVIDRFREGTISLTVDENDKLEVTYQEIRYFEYPSLKLTEFTAPIGFKLTVEGNTQPGLLKSGSETISNTEYEDILLRKNLGTERIKYRASHHYTTKINENGDCLELGSKWQKEIKLPKIICHLDQKLTTGDAYQFDTRIVDKGEDGNIFFGNHFDDLNREVWTCTDGGLNNKMLRVVNQLRVKPGRMDRIKELYYYDGLSIILGKFEDKSCLEIIEVKYLDPTHYEVLKYEGDVELSGEAARNSITMRPSTLQFPVKRDFHYTLRENELRKTELDVNGDIILEIGQKVLKDDNEHVKTNHEGLVCEHYKADKSTLMLMEPKIVMYKFFGSGFVPIKIDKKTFSNHFALDTKVWKCKGNDLPEIYRVQNLLKIICKESTGCNKGRNKISRVYHRDGITIISKDEVEEIKYVSGLIEGYKVLEFDGFMRFKDSVPTVETPLVFKEMNYYLSDFDIFNVAGPYGCRFDDGFPRSGVIFEVASHSVKEIEVTDHVVTCERTGDAEYKKEFGMKVNVYVKTKENNEWSQGVDIQESENFEGIAQETWMCKRDREEIFYKVKNYMVLSTELARVYHSDGVSVNWLVLPDTTKNVEIVEVKLIHPKTLDVFKYDGELKIVSKSRQTVAEKFFPFDSEEESSTAGRKAANYWSLNAMRVFVSRRRTVDNIDQTKHPYFRKKSFPLAMNFGGGHSRSGSRVVRVGTRCTDADEYKTTKTPMCMLNKWGIEYRSHYIPKVVEFYYDKWYEYDEDTFHYFFEIVKQEVWFCVAGGQDVIFRIITKFALRPEKSMLGNIGYLQMYEGCEMKIDKEYSVYYEETVFVNPINNKHFKYAGDLQYIRITTKIPPKSIIGIAGFYTAEYSKLAGKKIAIGARATGKALGVISEGIITTGQILLGLFGIKTD